VAVADVVEREAQRRLANTCRARRGAEVCDPAVKAQLQRSFLGSGSGFGRPGIDG